MSIGTAIYVIVLTLTAFYQLIDEQIKEEKLNAYRERVKRDVSTVLSQMCGRE